MIIFRPKTKVVNLIGDAMKHLDKENVSYKLITPKEADSVSKLNSKSLVLMEFIQNESGYYQMTVKDKEFYSWTQKLLGELCSMRIIKTDRSDRTVTAETDHLGIALDVLTVLGTKYNLSIVNTK